MKGAYSFLLAGLLMMTLQSCYHMPADDEFSVVPTINNPAVTNERSDHFMPGVGY